MNTITFDTYKFIKELEAAGVPHAQAEAMLKVQQEIIEHSIDNTLATKIDLEKMRQSTHEDIERLERRLIEHDGEFNLIRWMLGFILGGIIMVALKLYFPV